ncbi:MAG: division/cell wall cluster transcriptional repressor MraZ [Polymorphobacter sp.]|uniref:division/cell wall cluster transcriptional repressor MraZ n=1 Tax=Polymorphobacter sp. TaxID=1909290 RepID=UPI003A88FC06
MSNDVFLGYALNAVDAKSRLSIPADYRDALTARGSDRSLYIGPGHGGADCLLAYDQRYVSHAAREHLERHGSSSDRARFDEAGLLFGSAATVKIDDAGRIVLSATLKALGDIGGHVWFVGGLEWFEMWNPWRYLAREGLDPRIARLVRAEMAARGLDPDSEPGL